MATKLSRLILSLGMAMILLSLSLLALIQPIKASSDTQKLPILIGNAANQTISQFPIFTILPFSNELSQTVNTPPDGIKLVQDGSFEKISSNWLEVGDAECLPRISNWYTVTGGIVAYQGEQYFWAGGGCQIDGTVHAYGNSAEQMIAVPVNAPTLLFSYRALRVDEDSEMMDDYAYIEVDGVEVWRLDLTQANNSGNTWTQGVVDLSAYAGQFVSAKFGAINGEQPGIGNIFFDDMGFPGAITHVTGSEGSSFSYTNPYGYRIGVEVPSGSITKTVRLVLNPRTLPDPTRPFTNGLLTAHALFDLSLLSHSVYLPLVVGNGNETAVPLSPTHPINHLTGDVFQFPMTVTIYYDDENITGIEETSLRLYYWAEDRWVDAVTTCLNGHYRNNPAENYIQLPVCHLSEFAIGGLGLVSQ